jgi:hypothetical protein
LLPVATDRKRPEVALQSAYKNDMMSLLTHLVMTEMGYLVDPVLTL